jgi:hypothetical protein
MDELFAIDEKARKDNLNPRRSSPFTPGKSQAAAGTNQDCD